MFLQEDHLKFDLTQRISPKGNVTFYLTLEVQIFFALLKTTQLH